MKELMKILSNSKVVSPVLVKPKTQRRSSNTLPSSLPALARRRAKWRIQINQVWKIRSSQPIPSWRPMVTPRPPVTTTLPVSANSFVFTLPTSLALPVPTSSPTCWKSPESPTAWNWKETTTSFTSCAQELCQRSIRRSNWRLIPPSTSSSTKVC